jgi:hypothetical protein
MEYPAKLFHREISPYYILTLTKKKVICGFSGVIDPADFRSNYLGEYEAICEMALAR